jgi:FkbM family methyltransferase
MKKIKRFFGRTGLRLIRFLSRRLHINLLNAGLESEGYTKSWSMEESGELSFVRDFLPKMLKGRQVVFFDVGSNVGKYAAMLQQHHPQAIIHCFEPNPYTFETLQKNSHGNLVLNNFGLGETRGEFDLFFETADKTTVQASLTQEIIGDIGRKKNLESKKVHIRILEDYCNEKQVSRIDFLKIDTEGHEIETLRGAGGLLSKKAITCIQFEFNEVNIIKRRFLKDFYELLPEYNFYRLDKNRMIPMGGWHPNHEVFRFQNIVAVLKAVDPFFSEIQR